MFNGIIYNQGTIKDIRKSSRYVSGSLVMEVKSQIKFKKSDIGESVSCDGVCLTLIRIKKKSFLFYLSKETIKRSNFKYAKIGKQINIEKSLIHGQKISGNYVQGHVDTTALVNNIRIVEKTCEVRCGSGYSQVKESVFYSMVYMSGDVFGWCSLSVFD